MQIPFDACMNPTVEFLFCLHGTQSFNIIVSNEDCLWSLLWEFPFIISINAEIYESIKTNISALLWWCVFTIRF